MSLTYQQTQAIVKHRLKNSRRKININQKIMIRDWQIIANQFTETEIISQFRTMKFIFLCVFFFSSFQVSERIRHQISVSPTFQIGVESFFVFFCHVFFINSIIIINSSVTEGTATEIQNQRTPFDDKCNSNEWNGTFGECWPKQTEQNRKKNTNS